MKFTKSVQVLTEGLVNIEEYGPTNLDDFLNVIRTSLEELTKASDEWDISLIDEALADLRGAIVVYINKVYDKFNVTITRDTNGKFELYEFKEVKLGRTPKLYPTMFPQCDFTRDINTDIKLLCRNKPDEICIHELNVTIAILICLQELSIGYNMEFQWLVIQGLIYVKDNRLKDIAPTIVTALKSGNTDIVNASVIIDALTIPALGGSTMKLLLRLDAIERESKKSGTMALTDKIFINNPHIHKSLNKFLKTNRDFPNGIPQ